jgi:putative FmdB family regulatory protein
MPTYGYKCDKCGLEFEVHQSILAKPLKVCPPESCTQKKWGKGRVKRMIFGGGGLLFKGTGFYSTDYRSENYKQSAKKDAAPKDTTPAITPAVETKSPAPAVKPAPKADKK